MMKRKTFSKTFCLLYIYDRLKEKRVIRKDEIMDELFINDLTFKRYIIELRDYLDKIHSPCTIIYDRKNDRYLLKRKLD